MAAQIVRFILIKTNYSPFNYFCDNKYVAIPMPFACENYHFQIYVGAARIYFCSNDFSA